MKGLIRGALGSAGARRRQVEAPGAAAALPDAGGRAALRLLLPLRPVPAPSPGTGEW